MTTEALTAHQVAVKEGSIETRWARNDTWEAILRPKVQFLDAYRDFSAVPRRKNHLSGKHKEPVYIAVDANSTHMYLPGVRQHISAALELGVAPAEIMKVLEPTAALGIHVMYRDDEGCRLR